MKFSTQEEYILNSNAEFISASYNIQNETLNQVQGK